MKHRKLALLLCLTLLVSVLSPAMAFAAPPELDTPPDGPIDPAPYSYIDWITIGFTVLNNGASTSGAAVYISDTSYHCTLTLEILELGDDGYWNDNALKAWATFNGVGTTSMAGKTYNIDSYGMYCLAVTVDVYNSNNKLVESVTEYSRYAEYTSSGVTYYNHS